MFFRPGIEDGVDMQDQRQWAWKACQEAELVSVTDRPSGRCWQDAWAGCPLGSWAHRYGTLCEGSNWSSSFHWVLSELVVGVTGRISSRQSTTEQRPGVLGGALLAPEERVWEDRPREKTLPTRPAQSG